MEKRLEAFTMLGSLLLDLGKEKKTCNFPNQAIKLSFLRLEELVSKLTQYNGWFDENNVRRMMFSLGESLSGERLKKWVEMYEPDISSQKPSRTIAVVMAGNIPAVGFHDFLSVLISGNKLLAKLSSDDDKLIPAIADLLISFEPDFKSHIQFTSDTLKDFDAVIATGSNNTSRYFDYYFSKHPHIIRKNRNGIAVLSGNESTLDLEFLASDILDFYGLGCRNVSKLYVPDNYVFEKLLESIAKHTKVIENHKYFNNYEYNKAIFLVNGSEHFDTGNLLIRKEAEIPSPISVLHYEYYTDINYLMKAINANENKIQCVVTNTKGFPNSVGFGKSQQPELWDYADGVDTLKFLINL